MSIELNDAAEIAASETGITDNEAFKTMAQTLRRIADQLDAGERLEIFCLTYAVKAYDVTSITTDTVVASPVIMLGMLDIVRTDFLNKLMLGTAQS